MKTLQKCILVVAVAAALLAIYLGQRIPSLKAERQSLLNEQAGAMALAPHLQQIQRECQQASNAIAAIIAENAALKQPPGDLLRLRGTVGQLTRQKAQIASTSGLSKLESNPFLWQMVRSANKAEMAHLYQDFAKNLKLTEEQTGRFYNLLADDILENSKQVTALLRDKPSLEQVDRAIAAQEAALDQKVRDLLGPDALTQYQEYTRNLIGQIGAEEVRDKLTGSDDEKTAKVKQLAQLLPEVTKAALADAGLPPDFQPVPELNLRSVASEAGCDRSLTLVKDILLRTVTRSGTFLAPEDIVNLQKYWEGSVRRLKNKLTMERSFLAPVAE